MTDELDETARLLRREPNFDVVRNRIYDEESQVRQEVIDECGWTHEEFIDALRKSNEEYINSFPKRSIFKKLWSNITLFFYRCKKDIQESLESRNASR